MNKTTWRILVFAAMLASLVVLFRGVDWPAAGRCLSQLQARAPLIFVPYCMEVGLDAASWRLTFERTARVTWRGLLAVRVGTDALGNSLPAGIALAETMRALLLKERFGLPITAAAGNLVINKLTTALAQGLFVVLGLALATPALHDNSRRLIGRPGLEHWTLGVAVLFLTATTLILVVLAQGRILGRALALLQRITGPRVGVWLARFERPFQDLDYGLASADRVGRAQLARAVAISFCAWSALAAENWVIMHLLSPGISYAQAISIEAILSVVRVVFFFLPASLGAQEASYFTLIHLYGVPNADAVAVAFIIAKRLKELVWIAIGYFTLWRMNVRTTTLKEASALVASQPVG